MSVPTLVELLENEIENLKLQIEIIKSQRNNLINTHMALTGHSELAYSTIKYHDQIVEKYSRPIDQSQSLDHSENRGDLCMNTELPF